MATFRNRPGGVRAEVRMKGYYRSDTFRTKTQAKIWAADIEAKIRDGALEQASEKRVADALTKYGKEVSVNRKGRRWEQVRLKALAKDELSNRIISEVEPGDIAAFRDRRLAKVSPASVNRELNLISAVFQTAVTEWNCREAEKGEWISVNPCRGVKRPQNPKGRNRRVSEDEAGKICGELGYREGWPVMTKQQEVAIAFLLAIETAMRASEILSLDRARVHFEDRYCTLVDTKNGDTRDVPLSSRAVELLALLPNSGRLFSVTAASMSSLFRKARIRAGITDMTFHDSRHEAVTRLARKLDLLDLARMIGHRDLKSLQIYYNPTAAEIAKRLG